MSAAEQAAALVTAAKKQTDVEEARALIAEAQVHATLALVEQQRIGNAIAALKLSSADFEAKNPSSSSTAASRDRIARRNALAALVTEGLGIA